MIAKKTKKTTNTLRYFSSFLIFFIFIIMNLAYTADASVDDSWEIQLDISDFQGTETYVLFGEAPDANDGPPYDLYDIQKLPSSPSAPLINAWFDDGLEKPFDQLFRDYRKYPDTNKIWNLTVQWVPSDYLTPADITISWDITDLQNSEYDSIFLNDSNMLIEDSYTFSAEATKLYNFQIICEKTTSEPDDEEEPNDNGGSQGPNGQDTNQAPNIPTISSEYTTGTIYTNYAFSLNTTDPENDDIYYLVEWGDETNTDWIGPYNSGEQINLIHSWQNIGFFEIKAKAKDTNNTESNWSELYDIIIENIDQTNKSNEKPCAMFGYGLDRSISNTSIKFIDRSTNVNGSITKWYWDFGDGESSTLQDPTHTYADIGTYTVTLTVWNENGLSNTTYEEINVYMPSETETDGQTSKETPAGGLFLFLLSILTIISFKKYKEKYKSKK
jgi:PKD repeat protein